MLIRYDFCSIFHIGKTLDFASFDEGISCRSGREN